MMPHVFYRGPGIEGIPPREASDRLQIFQAKFDELWRKYVTFSGGEELFGLSITGSILKHYSLIQQQQCLKTVQIYISGKILDKNKFC